MAGVFIGMWLSLEERVIWDHEVAGSNPVIPIPNGRRADGYLDFFLLDGIDRWDLHWKHNPSANRFESCIPYWTTSFVHLFYPPLYLVWN